MSYSQSSSHPALFGLAWLHELWILPRNALLSWFKLQSSCLEQCLLRIQSTPSYLHLTPKTSFTHTWLQSCQLVEVQTAERTEMSTKSYRCQGFARSCQDLSAYFSNLNSMTVAGLLGVSLCCFVSSRTCWNDRRASFCWLGSAQATLGVHTQGRRAYSFCLSCSGHWSLLFPSEL